MRTVRALVAAGLLASATGCIEVNGQPSLGSGLLNSLFSQPTYSPQAYYQPAPQYIPVPVAQPQILTQPQYIPGATTSGRTWAHRDRNHNGVSDWQERRANRSG
ncbi:MAG: hypothetical protein ISP45_02205 [Reyranella sp.]|nr:hypothetical protein [Reyranella sp.]